VLLLPGEHEAWSYMLSPRLPRPSKKAIARSSAVLTVATVGFVGLGLVPQAGAEEDPLVHLTVNGSSSDVTTAAATVGGLLAQQSVSYDGNDLISPTTATDITNGMDVNVRSAVEVSVVTRGRRSQRIVPAQTASGVKQQFRDPQVAAPERARTYADQTFERINIYGVDGDLRTGSDTVFDGSTVVIRHNRVTFAQRTSRFHKSVKKVHSHLLSRGSVRVLHKGHAGRAHLVVSRHFVNGSLTSTHVVQRNVLRHATRRVVVAGSGPNWRRLAQCESGGNPNAVNPSGFYGLYQFSLSTWHAVGGKGNPTDHNYWEQTKRAWILFKGSGRSPWPVCGRYL
jgi:resuscitation-promoting factor RpfB